MVLTPLQEVAVPMVAGVLLQVWRMLRPTGKDAWTLCGCLAGALLLGLMPFKHEHAYSIGLHVLAVCGWFVVALACFFRDRLLPRLHEGAVLVWNATFAYGLGAAYGWEAWPVRCLLVLDALVTLALLARLRLAYAAKLAVYIWFLFVAVALAWIQFRFADFRAFSTPDAVPPPTLVAVVDGMAFAYLVMLCWFLLQMVPLPSRSQSFSERLKEWRSDADAMVGHMSDHQVAPWFGMVLVLALAAAFAGNGAYHVMDAQRLVAALLVFMPMYLPAIAWIAGKLDTGASRREGN